MMESKALIEILPQLVTSHTIWIYKKAGGAIAIFEIQPLS